MKRSDIAMALMLLLIGLIINWSGLTSPGMWWTDESRHAMHGVFFLDFFRDLPLQDPYGYVQGYLNPWSSKLKPLL